MQHRPEQLQLATPVASSTEKGLYRPFSVNMLSPKPVPPALLDRNLVQ
jgi:hypothetical protein